MFTREELVNIISWLPYRPDWPIDRNREDDGIKAHYGALLQEIKSIAGSQAKIIQDGGISNYIEIICFPKDQDLLKTPAFLVCISLCAPVAAYGEIAVTDGVEFFAWEPLECMSVGKVTTPTLKTIEKDVLAILQRHSIQLLSKDFACLKMDAELQDKMISSFSGKSLFDGIFQWED